MPPSRRRPPPTAGQAPPVRRPRVAGLRNRSAATREGAPETKSDTEQAPAPESGRESMSGTPTTAPSARTRPGTARRRAVRGRPGRRRSGRPRSGRGGPGRRGTGRRGSRDAAAAEPPPVPGRRPAGKRRATGTTRPADLGEAEAATKGERPRAEVSPRRRGATQLSVAVVLVVVAVVLAGLAVWFRGESTDLESADHNTALTDSATTSEVLGQLKSAIEQTFSYNYTDLGSTQKAVDDTLTGKARCEYDQLFGQVKKLAPKQKIVMVTAVRDIALVRLDGDRAEALVFIDQNSTRVDVNNSVAGEAQFAVLAHRDGDHWKITEFNMFDQPLVNGQPAPTC